MNTIIRLLLAVILLLLTIGAHGQDDNTNDNLAQALQGRDYYVEVTITNPEPFVGEQILYVLRYYAFYLPSDPFPYELPEFEDFWLGNTIESSDTRIESIGNRQFFVGEAVAEITPLNPGLIEIAPAVFEVDETVFREGARLESKQIQLNARSIPADAPEGFNGAVGQFDATISYTPDEIILGQPIAVTLTVDGSGNLELLPPPDLPEINGWRVYPSPTRYNRVNITGLPFGQKVFEWLLIPEAVGTATYDGFTFVYFDPRAGDYRTVDFAPITVQVLPGADNQQTLSEIDVPELRETQVLALHPVNTNTVDEAPLALFALVWLAPPILAIVIGAWHFDRQQRKKRRERRRQSNALRRALDRVESVDYAAPQTASKQLSGVLRAYIGDKQNLSTEEARGINLQVLISEIGLESDRKRYIQQTLDRLDALRYLPENSDYDLAAIQQQVTQCLQMLDEAYKST